MSPADLPARERIAAHLVALRAIVGGEADPIGREWNAMPEPEREAWLTLARASRHLSGRQWSDLPGELRARIKLVLRRAAERAAALLETAGCTALRS